MGENISNAQGPWERTPSVTSATRDNPFTDGSGPEAGQAQERLREILSGLEAQREARNAKAAGAQPASRAEGIYMMIFQAFLILMFGGLDGHLAARLDAPLKAPQTDWLASIGDDLAALPDNFLRHASGQWYIDVLLFAMVVVIATGVRTQRARRRWFSGATALTIVVLGGLMAAAAMRLVPAYS